jgi:serine/threonine protein kinase
MEKWALKKLAHPGVVTLYATFQDYYCLYFALEHCTGGELWEQLSYKGFMVRFSRGVHRHEKLQVFEPLSPPPLLSLFHR